MRQAHTLPTAGRAQQMTVVSGNAAARSAWPTTRRASTRWTPLAAAPGCPAGRRPGGGGFAAEVQGLEVGGKPHVSLRHACEAIGIDPEAQRRKLRNRSWACAVQETAQLDGQRREYTMIDRRTFTMWLGGIDENRVSAEARPVLIAFQAEAAEALDAYFMACPTAPERPSAHSPSAATHPRSRPAGLGT